MIDSLADVKPVVKKGATTIPFRHHSRNIFVKLGFVSISTGYSEHFTKYYISKYYYMNYE
jgi:hypothetical protein